MRRDASFWRNVGIIGALHVAVLAGVVRWSSRAARPSPSDILWMGAGVTAENVAATVESKVGAPEAQEPVAIEEGREEAPIVTTEPPPPSVPAKSDIEMSSPTPTAIPKPTATPSASPLAKVSPKATPKPTPHKAKASPKSTATPKKKTAAVEPKKISAKPDVSPNEPARESSPAAAKTSGVSGAAGSEGKRNSPGGTAQFGRYASMLHDRFFSEWVQPTTIAATGAKMSALVRIRIEKDGRVSNFEIVRASGNVVVDESVAAVARRVTQVEPLPGGLGAAGHYDVKINFELNPEQ
jgi:TonB family protein